MPESKKTLLMLQPPPCHMYTDTETHAHTQFITFGVQIECRNLFQFNTASQYFRVCYETVQNDFECSISWTCSDEVCMNLLFAQNVLGCVAWADATHGVVSVIVCIPFGRLVARSAFCFFHFFLCVLALVCVVSILLGRCSRSNAAGRWTSKSCIFVNATSLSLPLLLLLLSLFDMLQKSNENTRNPIYAKRAYSSSFYTCSSPHRYTVQCTSYTKLHIHLFSYTIYQFYIDIIPYSIQSESQYIAHWLPVWHAAKTLQKRARVWDSIQ